MDRRLVGIPAEQPGIINSMFGAHTWAALNLEANIFATLPRYPWGIKTKD